MHIWIGLPLSSLADKVKVTAVLFVAGASLLITIDPVGGLVSGSGGLENLDSVISGKAALN
jgi:hypothetical protein